MFALPCCKRPFLWISSAHCKPLKERSLFAISENFHKLSSKQERSILFYTIRRPIASLKTEPKLELEGAAVIERVGDLTKIG